jgi:16S rRNA (guanine(966)-N(2))-methyltransferase RsmD
MRTQLRIVAGSLRGRKLTYTLDPGLRPTPDMVREALFNILGDAVPERPFFDLFAGTGAVGLEALSRGAVRVEFVERDARLASNLVRNLQAFAVADQARVHRADVYRWAEHWNSCHEPVNVFLGPPFDDLDKKQEALTRVLSVLQQKLAPGSVLTLQSEKTFDPNQLPEPEDWEHRLYGRNRLSIWMKSSEASANQESQ